MSAYSGDNAPPTGLEFIAKRAIQAFVILIVITALMLWKVLF